MSDVLAATQTGGYHKNRIKQEQMQNTLRGAKRHALPENPLSRLRRQLPRKGSN